MTRTPTPWATAIARSPNRRIVDPRAEIRALRTGALDGGARRRAERRVRLFAALVRPAAGPPLEA
jgi:hypothetical protein